MPFLAAVGVLATWLAAAADGPPFVVALDAGHGGSNLGAPTADADKREKHLTLELARRVQKRLAGEHGLSVVLCRDSDALVPLRARSRCANQAGARLFISIHANAASAEQGPGTQRGFEIYVLPVADVDKEAARGALLAADDAEAAWAAHSARETAAASLATARRIRWRLADALGQQSDRGIKQKGATLDVLQGLEMPAVLVEVGYLDHAEEGPYLLSEKGMATISEALAGAITDLHGRESRGKKDPLITAPQGQRRRLDTGGPAAATGNRPGGN